MREVTQSQVVQALADVGIQAGDGLIVHSAIQFLGRPQGGPGMYLEAMRHLLGAGGTIAVPTFNFAFARGERYDPSSTPSAEMGVFAEYVRQLPEARRTSHPMQSMAIVGKHATDLAQRDTLSAFDPGSAFERMLELDFKLLYLGADIRATSAVHYSEQRAGVPYRHWKDFTGEIYTANGWEKRTYRMFVRDLEMDPHMTADAILALLKSRSQWIAAPLNYGEIAVCRIAHMVQATDELIQQDPWVMVENRAQAQKIYQQRQKHA
jgi:aminoglycoside 3-N-acetyltransferase